MPAKHFFASLLLAASLHAAEPSYARDIAPIFAERCDKWCRIASHRRSTPKKFAFGRPNATDLRSDIEDSEGTRK